MRPVVRVPADLVLVCDVVSVVQPVARVPARPVLVTVPRRPFPVWSVLVAAVSGWCLLLHCVVGVRCCHCLCG